MTVIYEVNLDIHAKAAADFAQWLPRHVADVLALPGFIDAVIAREDPGEEGSIAWSVRYRLENRQALERYLDQHAERMRADGLRRFGEGMRARRRILSEVEHLKAS